MVIRTGFSFRTAAGHLPEVASRLKEIGWSEGVICDRMSTFGFVKFTKACKKEDLRPVYGVEIGVTPQLWDAKEKKRPPMDYWKFLAVSNLRGLHDLIAEASSNPGKEPYLTYAQVADAYDVFKISGPSVLLDHVELDDFFVGLSPALPLFTYRQAVKRGLKFIAVSDNYYTRKEDREFYRVLMGRNASAQVYPQHILSDDEWRDSVRRLGVSDAEASQACLNRHEVLQACRAEIKRATLIVADKPATLLEMCLAGAAKLGVDAADEVYAARLKRELDMIEEKQFADYFYVLADVINWAKERMIVGPARGSSCGSLVCFLLGITTVDPIPYGLLFDRFIDTTRSDLPDVDVDFSDVRRDQVFRYMEDKFGAARIARLGSVGQYKAKSALNQVGLSLKIPTWTIAKVADGAIKRSGGDSRAGSTIEDTLTDTEAGREMITAYPEARMVIRMENHPSSAGQHAAGVVLTQEPIAEFVAVNAKTGGAMCDKKDAEDLNLLKIDALGLTQLSVFERTLELLGIPSRNGFLETIPLDDKAAFEVLNRGHFAGVFQFTGSTVKALTKEITIEHLEDMIAITALARPGPISSGGAEQWVRRRNGVDPVTYPHEMFRKHVDATLGIVLYQEQVMTIGRDIGDLSWEDVNALRRAMSKSLGKEFFDKYGDRWKAGAIAKGIPASVLDGVWDDLVNYGAMAFNRAHSVAYGLVSYWTCWLKAHHPLEFAAATLDAEPDPFKQITTLKELASEGIEYVPVDPNKSTGQWVPAKIAGKTVLVGPLQSIHGIGPKGVEEILLWRAKGGRFENGEVVSNGSGKIKESTIKKLLNPKTAIDSLFPIADAIARLHPDLVASQVLLPQTVPDRIIDLVTGMGRVVVLGLANKFSPSDDNAEVKVAKRNGKRVPEPSMSLNLFLRDDTDEVICRIGREDYQRLGIPIIDRGGAGKALYAILGDVPRINFRMVQVKAIKYLGSIEDDHVDATDPPVDVAASEPGVHHPDDAAEEAAADRAADAAEEA